MTRRPASRGTVAGEDGRARRIVAACAFVSGLTALIYLTAWLRQFAFAFGDGAGTLPIVLFAYLGGAAGGAIAAGRLASRSPHPARALALAQAGTAITALLVPLLISVGSALYVGVLGDRPMPPDAAARGLTALELLVACVALALPGALAAASLPLGARAAPAGNPARGAASAIGTAAFGGACGAAAAGYALVPALGLNGATWVGAAINLAACAAMLRVDRQAPAAASAAPPGFYSACIRPLLPAATQARDAWRAALTRQTAWLLPGVGLTAASACGAQVLWARLLAQTPADGRSASTLAAVAIMAGIAVGAVLAARLQPLRRHAGATFVGTRAASAAAALLIYMLVVRSSGPAGDALSRALLLVGAPLSTALLLGAGLVSAQTALRGSGNADDRVLARVLAWSAGGTVAGAALAGAWLLPALGFGGAVEALAVTDLGIALWLSVTVTGRRPAVIGAASAGLLAVVALVSPPRPAVAVTEGGAARSWDSAAAQRYYAVGRSATVAVVERDGVSALLADGRAIATVAATGSPPRQDVHRWLAALPVTARPDTGTVLLLGFAGGATLEGVPASVGAIDIIEPEQRLIDASIELSRSRGRDPASDERITIVNADARRALRLTSRRYDAILSQTVRAASPGRDSRYSRELLGEIKAHLNDAGVFAQRVPAASIDAQALRAQLSTLADAFGHVRAYRPAADELILLASDSPIEPELQLARSGRPITNDVMHFSRMGINGVEDLLAALALDEAGVEALTSGAPIGTDDNQLLARDPTRTERLNRDRLAALLAPHDPLAAAGGWIYSRFSGRVDFGYITRRLVSLGEQARAVAAAEAQPDASARLLMLGILYAARNDHDQAATAFRAAVERRAANAQARYLLIEPGIGPLSNGTADPELTMLAQGLPASAAAVIEGWGHAAEQNWESLARLDGVLGRAAVTDAWYPAVVRLRANWRGQATQDVERLAFDALRLIDRAVLIEPTTSLYLLRAATGIATHDAGVAIESSRQIVRLLRDELEQAQARDGRIGQRRLAIIRQNLNAVVTNLSGELVAGNERRAEDVRRGANEILRYIDAVMASQDE